MSAAAITSYVEVYVWRGKDRNNYTTTSSEGIRHRLIDAIKGVQGFERCGHVSMGIYQDKLPCTYISLWPSNSAPSVLMESFDNDLANENSNPDVILRLHHLDIPRMLEEFNKIKIKIERKEIAWVMEASDNQDVTNSEVNSTANCTSFVWSFLKIGGLEPITKTEYAKSVSLSGPKDGDFYKIVKCNIGQRFGGVFDGWWWTRQYFTPYGLVLRVASALEAYEDDKTETVKIMKSERVVQEPDVSSSSTTMAATIGLAVLGGVYLMKK
jgi:hypothetical protein